MPLTWSMAVFFFNLTVDVYNPLGTRFVWDFIQTKRNETYQSQSRMLCRCCCSCCWWHEIKITKSCISIAIIRHSFPNNQTNYHDSQRAKIIIQCMIIRCDMVKMYMQSFKCRVWMYFSLLISLISLLNAVNFCSYPGCNAFFFSWNSNIAKCHYHPSIL